MVALMSLVLVLDHLGRLFLNFYQYSQTKVYLLSIAEKYLRPVSEVFFYMEVKPDPCLQKTCHKLKDVTMQ